MWNVATQHNVKALWLKDLKEEYCRDVTHNVCEITNEIPDKVLSKLANDKLEETLSQEYGLEAE